MRWKILLLLLLVAITVSGHADTLTSVYDLSISNGLVRTRGARTLRDSGKLQVSINFADGTATDSAQADTVFTARDTVTSGTPIIYDIASLTGSFGDKIGFDAVKLFAVKNLSLTSSLVIGGGSTPWPANASPATEITVHPGGVHSVLAPFAGMPASGATNLRISTDSIASYDLILIGH